MVWKDKKGGNGKFVYFRTTTKVTKIKKYEDSEAIDNGSGVIKVRRRKLVEQGTKQVTLEACCNDPRVVESSMLPFTRLGQESLVEVHKIGANKTVEAESMEMTHQE